MYVKHFLCILMILFVGLSGCRKTPKEEYKRIKITVLKIQKKVGEGNLSVKKKKDYLKQLDKLEETIDELEIDVESAVIEAQKETNLLQKGFNYVMLEDLRLKIINLRQQLKTTL